MQNAIYSIRPYRYQNESVFDDERVDLVREPFVMGIPQIIDRAVQHLPDPQNGFSVLFNDTGLSGADIILIKQDEEAGGNWYACEQTGLRGWLCPARYRYYPIAPERLFIKISP